MSFVSFVFACLQLCTLLSSFVWNLLKSLPVRNRNNHTCILNVCYHTCIEYNAMGLVHGLCLSPTCLSLGLSGTTHVKHKCLCLSGTTHVKHKCLLPHMHLVRVAYRCVNTGMFVYVFACLELL